MPLLPLSLLFLALLSAPILLDQLLRDVWPPPATEVLAWGVHWCEEVVVHRFARTQLNSFSALGFVAAGYLVAVLLARPVRSRARNHLTAFPLLGWLQVATFVWAGAAAFGNHASVTHWSREPDRASIWALIIWPAVVASLRVVAHCPAPQWVYWSSLVAILLLNATAMTLHMGFGDSAVAESSQTWGIPVAAGLVCVATLLKPLLRPGGRSNWWLFAASAVCLAAATALRDPVALGVCGDPGPVWRTHAAWHLLAALSLLLLWMFFHSEQSDLAARRLPLDEL